MAVTRAAAGCLNDDVIWRFVQGELPDDQARGADEHLTRCADCRNVVAETARFLYQKTATTVGRYVIARPLGAGAAGVVYEAHDPQLRRKIALKLIRPAADAAAAEDRMARLLTEAQAMARLSHPNVVAVHDAGTHEGQVFVAMELVDGRTLADWLRDRAHGRDEILDVFVAAGRGLAAAHAAGLVHRDFKPDNVLIGADGRARVTDFGLATGAGTSVEPGIAGTPSFMSPEQWMGREADARSDQFSFCVALYAALTGRHPFDAGKSIGSLAEQVLAGAVAEDKGLSRWLRTVLLRGLSVDPARRFGSVDELLGSLERGRMVARRLRRAFAAALLLLAIGGIRVFGAAGACGNGKLEPAEECDDGNRSDGDGCLATCRAATCGDGRQRTAVEECDDGNRVDGDACNNQCLRCAPGFSWPDNGHCYVRHETVLPWDQAARTCRDGGGHLVTYNAYAEMTAVIDRLLATTDGTYWTGLRDQGGYGWLTREPLTFGFRGWGTPTPPPGQCAAGSAKTPWVVEPCVAPRGFMCERPGWAIAPGSRHAYQAFYGEPRWEAARDACVRFGAGVHLATIADAEENAFVAGKFFGAHWVGATKIDGAFRWITGPPFDPALFAEGDPDLNAVPACVAIGEDRRLHDRQCDGSDGGPQGYGYICEVD